MRLKDSIEIAVNIALGLGFIILLFGIGLWVFNLSQRFRLSTEVLLIIYGCIFLFMGALAAKVFSKIGN